jgi:hypothetical protein
MQVLKGYYGAAKPVALLRGSTAKDMQPWMIEVSASAAALVCLHPYFGTCRQRRQNMQSAGLVACFAVRLWGVDSSGGRGCT